jgi:hypothetical protein
MISGFAHVLYPAALAMAHNVATESSGDSWPHMSAATQSVRGTDLARIRRVSSDRAETFIESIDDFLAAYESMHDPSNGDDASSKAVGIGVFYFEEDKAESDVFK